ncbi:MAG: hypothetical protein ACI94Y_002040 [Maribacter sp.]
MTLEEGNNKIINCEIHDFNRIEKSYRPAVKIEGVGNMISHCKIYNGINQAILLKGNNHIIEYNNIHDVCLNMDDAGALYYGRNPSERGHIVRHNYFHHIGNENEYQTSAIYHDDGACGMEVYENIFLKAGSIGIFMGRGSDNYYHNDLFLDCLVGIHIDDRLNNWGAKFIPIIKTRLEDIKYDKPPYSTQYPSLANYWNDTPTLPKRNTFENNAFCSIGMLFSVGNKLLDWKNTNSLSNGYPSIWNEQINNRDFTPNDMYLPLPAKWDEIQKDSIGVVSD